MIGTLLEAFLWFLDIARLNSTSLLRYRFSGLFITPHTFTMNP
jgi:hypothetical protein